ncbi:heme biosynthesis protein [Nitrincola tibetensis]|uniref:Heme biosynthesis protein n=1 Tax=Nitrincola tibetensis TaxID=2219697 RepID=A0A364NII9_9GAMM|nr:uroporphyrinogen-III C-methyltransferase [Nitrincola tibetensis]RAU16864.1 heme biosynthesis protein [Nitrincola tibetensis]
MKDTPEKKNDSTTKKTQPEQSTSASESSGVDETTSAKTDAKEATSSEKSAPVSKEPSVEPVSASNEPPTKPEMTPATQPTSSNWPGKVALVLSVAALGLSGYMYWSSEQSRTQIQLLSANLDSALASAKADSSERISGISQQLGQVQERTEQLRSLNTKTEQSIETLHGRLTQAVQQMNAQQQVSDKDWLLAEAEYLLRLANQRVLMENSASGALALLRSADKVLQEADDVSLYPIRQSLAADISALEGVPRLDVEGIYLRLSAMSQQTTQLRMSHPSDQRQLPNLLDDVTPDSLKESWGAGAKAALNKAMDKLDQLVVIQHRDAPIAPLLAPDQIYYLQQNLHLMFEQAQTAVLQRRQGAYEESLSKASTWIGDYFDTTEANAISLLRAIEELKTFQVAPELPSIATSLNALKEHMAEVRRLQREGGN